MPYFLIVVGLILVILNVRAIKNEKNSFKQVLSDKEYDLSEVDVRIGELRREFSETILELQKEILSLKEEQKSKELTLENISDSNAEDYRSIDIVFDKEEVISEVEVIDSQKDNENLEEKSEKIHNGSNRIKEIGELLDKGTSIDEICEKFKMGKGELLLIKDLYLK
jgi:hypothetical protein